MFDSGYPVEKLVLEVESETNLAFPVTRESYVSWYNLCEQGLYSDVIKEEKTECADYKAGLCLSDIPASDGYYDFMRSDDVQNIFLDVGGKKHEMEHVSLENYLRGIGADYAYAKEGNRFIFRKPDGTADGKLYFLRIIRPVPKRVIGETISGTVMLPEEYLELMRCRLRGEKYRLMNEDVMCAKWINEYNYHLQMFTAFIEARRARL